jgi:hypothetical protein
MSDRVLYMILYQFVMYDLCMDMYDKFVKFKLCMILVWTCMILYQFVMYGHV